jgi:hypothetical protein
VLLAAFHPRGVSRDYIIEGHVIILYPLVIQLAEILRKQRASESDTVMVVMV